MVLCIINSIRVRLIRESASLKGFHFLNASRQCHLVISYKSTLTSSSIAAMGSQETRVNEYARLRPAQGNGLRPDLIVDLRSDTLTKPNKEMRLAMVNAEVGDDVFHEDPTIKELETRVAQIFGKEAALFVASGTMSNLLAALVHCNERGSEMIVGSQSHMYYYEQGNISQFGGVHSSQSPSNRDGTFSIDDVLARIRIDDDHCTKTKLIAVENTHNRSGGRVMPMDWLDKICKVGKDHGIAMHMDGSRVFNAATFTGLPVSRIVRDFDSVSVCFSKGLCAPVGSVLTGSAPFIKQARRLRKALGGGMRQIGILAAAALYSLDHLTSRLADDHDNAKIIANMINKLRSPFAFVKEEDLETNIVMLHVRDIDANDLQERLEAVEECEKSALGEMISVRCQLRTNTLIRLVTHADISRDMAVKAGEKIAYVIKEMGKKIKQ